MQASSDIFLGWQRTHGMDGIDRNRYMRQLRDWMASAEVEGSLRQGKSIDGLVCGWTLARAHARFGDRVALRSAIDAGLDRHDDRRGDLVACRLRC